MINLLHLNKLIKFIIFTNIFILSFNLSYSAEDIWKNSETVNEQEDDIESQNNIIIKSPILSGDTNKVVVTINENELDKSEDKSVIGIFDPEENNFNLNMWSATDGEDIKKVLKRIDGLKLSKPSEELLFQILFTNAYAPRKNLSAEEFLQIKINWLIKKKRIKDLERLLSNNKEVGKNTKAIKFLVNEYLSSADIGAACEKINFIDREVKNDYLEKFKIYCLINSDNKDEAQLIYDLLRERGFKDKFFDDKINFLLGITQSTNQKILDNNLLNFYFSHITSDSFSYQPKETTDKYIWSYLTASNLIQTDNLIDENIIVMYEQAAAQNSFDNDEIFKIYLKMNFSFTQLANASEIYKTLPNFKARALLYQSIILTDSTEKKINLLFILKDLFIKDKILSVYIEELSNILKSIEKSDIPENYVDLVNKNLESNFSLKVKFNNDILHRSKVIKHFLENEVKINRTEKDFKTVYKKIKRNKKYFISIKDIVVLESLAADGINIPEDLNYNELSSDLTVPKNLEELAQKNQIGLVMLKIVEIIGEDNIGDLDPETVYFLNRILNTLNLKKIRNSILSEALPEKV